MKTFAILLCVLLVTPALANDPFREARLKAVAARAFPLTETNAAVKPELTSGGHAFRWSAAENRYRPVGAGWQYDAGTGNWWRYKVGADCPCGPSCPCPAGACPVACPPAGPMLHYAPPVMQLPMMPMRGGPMVAGNCAGGT